MLRRIFKATEALIFLSACARARVCVCFPLECFRAADVSSCDQTAMMSRRDDRESTFIHVKTSQMSEIKLMWVFFTPGFTFKKKKKIVHVCTRYVLPWLRARLHRGDYNLCAPRWRRFIQNRSAQNRPHQIHFLCRRFKTEHFSLFIVKWYLRILFHCFSSDRCYFFSHLSWSQLFPELTRNEEA